MSILWTIVEDNYPREQALFKAIQKKDPEAQILWLYVDDAPDPLLPVDPIRKNCLTKQSLNKEIESIQGASILLLDIRLGGITCQIEHLKETVLKFLNGNTQRIVHITSCQMDIDVRTAETQYREAAVKRQLDSRRITKTGEMLSNTDSKDHERVAKKIIDEVVSQWNRLFGQPLERVWEATKYWFNNNDNIKVPSDSKGAYSLNRLPHDYDNNACAHKKVVQNVWHWFPDRWWDNADSARNLHNILKCTCGCSVMKGERNLSVGSILILAGMACDYTGIKNTFAELQSWAQYPYSNSRIFPLQTETEVKSSVSALFSFFIKAFVDKNTGVSTVQKMSLEEEGRILTIWLTYSAHDLLAKCKTRILKPISKRNLDLRSTHTLDLLLQSLLMMMLGKRAIFPSIDNGGGGAIRFERQNLIIEGGNRQC